MERRFGILDRAERYLIEMSAGVVDYYRLTRCCHWYATNAYGESQYQDKKKSGFL
jgi:hypothetical protein